MPVCLIKCGYCSFYSEVYDEEKIKNWYQAILREIDYYCCNFKTKASTIYLGGGTPSLLPVDWIGEIVKRIPRSRNCETTIEMNPQDVTETKVLGWRNAGINRVSLGTQSMDDKELQFLGRRHSVADNIKTISIIKKKFSNISFDLIYGLPGQKIADVLASVKKFLDYKPQHISAYCLSLSEDCPLSGYRAKLPAEDISSEMYYEIRKLFLEENWQQYELSSFCQHGMYSRHNLAYWENKYYFGCGPSACGYLPGFRWQNAKNLNLWQQQIYKNEFFYEREVITPQIRETEQIILALRTAKGLNLAKFKSEFGMDFRIKYDEILARMVRSKLMEEKHGYVRLRSSAYFISNEILKEFV